MGLFKRRTADAIVQQVVTPAKPFPEKMLDWIEALDWYERESSGIISTEAFSELRRMNDLLRATARFLKTYPVKAEEEYIIENTIQTYIPSTLNIFNQLPLEDQTPGGKADVQLVEQFRTMHENVYKLNQQMQENVRRDLNTQTQFVQDRFAAPIA